MNRLRIIFIAATVAACSQGPVAKTSAAPCALMPGDTVYLAGGPVYRECAVDRRAQVVDRSAHPDFQPTLVSPGQQGCYSADVEFVVDRKGVPESEGATVLRTTDELFAASALRAVARWRYKPAELNGVAVRQIVHEKVGIGFAVVAVRAGETPRPPVRGPTC